MLATQLQQEREDHVHKGFCDALVDDFRATTRYVALDLKNLATFSNEFVRLLLDICSELEAVAKLLCERRQPGSMSGRPNIADWGAILRNCPPDISKMTMRLDGWFDFVPFEDWQTPLPDGKFKSPEWWEAYQHVKHNRTLHFEEANQKNVCFALCGLTVVCYVALPSFQTRYIHRIT